MYTKMMMLVLGCFFGFAGTAQQPEDMVVEAGNLQHVAVAANMQVRLVQTNDRPHSFSMNSAASAQLQIGLTAGTLQVAPGTAYHNAVVYVLVQDLRTLTVGHNSVVKTDGILHAPEITVYADGNAQAVLRTNGKVNAFSLYSDDITIVRTPIVAGADTF